MNWGGGIFFVCEEQSSSTIQCNSVENMGQGEPAWESLQCWDNRNKNKIPELTST
jgi:hypothetical protein